MNNLLGFAITIGILLVGDLVVTSALAWLTRDRRGEKGDRR